MTASAGIHSPFLHSRPSLDNKPDNLWDAVGRSAPSSATAAHEGPDEREFSDAARRDRMSELSRSELPTSGPKCPRQSASNADVVAPTRADQPQSSAVCIMLSMSSLCRLSILHTSAGSASHTRSNREEGRGPTTTSAGMPPRRHRSCRRPSPPDSRQRGSNHISSGQSSARTPWDSPWTRTTVACISGTCSPRLSPWIENRPSGALSLCVLFRVRHATPPPFLLYFYCHNTKCSS